MEYKEFKARTVDDAITSACISYGVSSDRLEYDVITEGKAGIFGFGRKDAVIRARVRTEKEREKEAKAIAKAEAKDALLNKMPGEAKPARKPEKKAEKKTEKKDPSGKNEAKTAKKGPAKSEEKPAEKKESVKKEEKQTEKKAPAKKEVKKQKFAAETAAEEVKPVEKRTERPQARGIVTADEIEKRAAEAAARAKEAGIDLSDSSEDAGKEKRRGGGRNRRGRGRNDRRDSRRRERFGDERVTVVEEKPHKPSQPKPERVVVPKSEEEIAEMKKTAMDFLTNIFRCMETEVSITMDYDEKEGCLNATFDGEDMGILIGKRGQTLDSLQYLTSLVINKNHSDYTRV